MSSEPRCELGSHADTCVFGKHCHTLDVTGVHSSMNTLKNVCIACVCVAYDCVNTMNTCILVFDQYLFIPSLDVNLLCVDQLRENDIKVNDIHLIRLREEERTNESHSIMCTDTGLHIPLEFNKPISYFKCRVPTLDEVNDETQNTTVHMTSSIEWEPYDDRSKMMEENMRRHVQSQSREIYTLFSRSNPYISSCPYALSQLLSMEQKGQVSSVLTKGKSYIIKPEQLARRWRTSLECATRTIEKTEQRALRNWRTVRGDRRFRPTQMQLKYPRLNCEVFCDIKFGPCKSLEGNTCLAVFATNFQWVRAYPLNKERDAHHSLSHLFRDFGLPEVLISDSALSLTHGEYKKTASRAQVPITGIEPFHPNQNLVEDTIREGCRLYNRFMTARNIPTALWDRVFTYCLEIRSHMALGHASQKGECGTTIIKESTADISHLCDFIIYD